MPPDARLSAAPGGKVPGAKVAWSGPTTLVALFAAGQIVAWTLAPALTHRAPPLDVVEGYMWGREWVIATYKHPALPSWFLEASRLLTGSVGWPAYLVSQLCVATAYAFVYLLGRDMMGPERAAAGTLLLAGVAYYAWPTPEFNHNIAGIPFWAGVPLALWHAVERRSFVWWALTGAFAAGALYAKFSSALLLVVAAAWIVLDRRSRSALTTPGPWVGFAVFAVLTAPLAAWLLANDLAPLEYAASRSTGRPVTRMPFFLLDTVANLAGIFVVLVIAGLWRRADGASQLSSVPDARAKRFLLAFTVGPLVLAVIGFAISRSGLKTAWGTPMFNLAGLLAIALASDRFHATSLRRIALSAAVLLVVVPIGYAAVITLNAQWSRLPTRVNWPQAEIAQRMGAIWARETGSPLRIVAGDSWTAGLVGVTSKDRPSILTNGDVRLSPWVTAGRLEADGALVLWHVATGQFPAILQQHAAAARTGQERFSFRGRDQPELIIGYAIIPPRPGPR